MKKYNLPVLFLLSLVFGCQDEGPPTYSVSGTVKWDKKPLPDGQIVFESTDGSLPHSAGRIRNGNFSFRSTKGLKKVKIFANRFKAGQENVVMGVKEKEQYIPAEYNSETTLKAEVDPAKENVFHYDLKK